MATSFKAFSPSLTSQKTAQLPFSKTIFKHPRSTTVCRHSYSQPHSTSIGPFKQQPLTSTQSRAVGDRALLSTWRSGPIHPFLHRSSRHSTHTNLRTNTRSNPRRLLTSAALIPAQPLAGLAAVAVVTGVMAILSRFHGRWYERKCDVVSGGGPVVSEAQKSFGSILEEPYRPVLPTPDCHVETIFAAFTRSLLPVVFKRQCLHMPDGGVVALDWPLAEGQLAGVPPAKEGAPVLILLPGLTGGSEDTYVRHMLVRARKEGWGCVVFNSRGCAHSPVTTPQFYSASFTEDLRRVIAHVQERSPGSRLYAAGWSLGANILVRYLGQEGESTPLTGAVSLCNPFDLVLADKNFHIGFNNVYDRKLAKSLNNIFRRHIPLFEGLGGEYNIELVKTAKTVRDFDDGLTRVSFGYPSVDAYYADASSCKNIKEVRIPLLCIQAEDDPIAPIQGTPFEDFKKNPNTLLVVTPYGGHLGWVAGEEAPFGCPWTDPMVMKFLNSVEKQRQPESESGGLDSPVRLGSVEAEMKPTNGALAGAGKD